MNSRLRYAAYSSAGISIVLTLLLAYPEVIRSRAKVSAGASTANLVPRNAGMVEEATITLKPVDRNTFTYTNRAFPSNTTYWPCGGYPTHGIGVAEPRGEEVLAGYDHYFDAGTKPFPCQERLNDIYRGAVWFDLSEIRSKLPGVFVTSASLHFRPVENFTKMSDGNPFPGTKYCANELLVASVDWRKGYKGLPPGGPFKSISQQPGKGVVCDLGGGLGGLFFCSVEVGPVVNNWVTGKEDDFGFVIKGEDEAPTTEDNGACWTRYDNFELTVNYKYDKPMTPASYPLECRGIETLKVIDDGPPGSKWVGFTFIPGTGPAKGGLLPGQCSWLDRGMRAGEPAKLAQAIEGAGGWMKELNSSDSYWTFNVYNAGGQLQATGAERSKKFFVPLLRTNYALAANGGKVFASSTHAPYFESYVNDGELTGAGNAVWLDDTLGVFPDYLEVRFAGEKRINEIDVITRQDDLVAPVDPKKLDPSFSKPGYGITAYDVQYWEDGGWITVASVVNNDKVWRKFTPVFPILTDRIRIQINAGQDNAFSRVVEVEAWGN